MEALLRCQVSQTVPRDQPQERCTTLPFKLLTATHTADINGWPAKKQVQKKKKKISVTVLILTRTDEHFEVRSYSLGLIIS